MAKLAGIPRVVALPSVRRLKELLAYDPLTGVLTWRVDRPGRWNIKAGDRAGTQREDGYRYITIDGVRLAEHRIVWAMMTGAWPEKIVDHRDTDPTNNRWDNLREADGSESAANKNTPVSNTSGIKGVRERKGRWLAQITIRGETKFLGSYATSEEAREAYNNAANDGWGEYARSA